METVSDLGRNMAMRMNAIAAELTAMIWVRVLTLPEMAELQARPTIMRSQYTAAIAPPMAAPPMAMPAPLEEASER